MWTVIYVAPTTNMAERIQDTLMAEGFFVKIRQVGESKQCEILVPQGELEEVQDVLNRSLMP